MVGHVFLGKYKTVRQLDEGGMSRIYLARQTKPDREVVVKVLKETHLAQSTVREHFRREIHITSRFQHPYAVAFIDADPRAADGPILVLEYLRGVDLHTLLHREKRFTPERIGRLLAQLCSVLQVAHDAGIVHRDIKPGNLMILYPGTQVEQLKLMDFGLAKMSSLLYISPDELVDFTLPPAAGTPEYIAPEQVRGNEMDGRGDLYSVGVVLFEMLTGQRPFVAATVGGLMQAHAEAPPPTFAELGLADLVPPAVEQLIRDCLGKHPDDRPPNAAELLRRYEQGLGKRFPLPRRSVAVPNLRAMLAAKDAAGPSTPPPTKTVKTIADVHAIQHSFEARMPESMAMLKLKGFIHDLGGQVVDSVPGLIRVRLGEAVAEKKGGLFGWMDRRPPVQTVPATTEIELHMARPDPSQPGRLMIKLVLRPASGAATAEWKTRCNQISRDLQAYLMGR
ncbi:MAG TPA: serine/threonine-protein kinase [Gemmataceae bacterium]|nr:serine/threonine-protein kinase [Gemmataceae bacterium]